MYYLCMGWEDVVHPLPSVDAYIVGECITRVSTDAVDGRCISPLPMYPCIRPSYTVSLIYSSTVVWE